MTTRRIIHVLLGQLVLFSVVSLAVFRDGENFQVGFGIGLAASLIALIVGWWHLRMGQRLGRLAWFTVAVASFITWALALPLLDYSPG